MLFSDLQHRFNIPTAICKVDSPAQYSVPFWHDCPFIPAVKVKYAQSVIFMVIDHRVEMLIDVMGLHIGILFYIHFHRIRKLLARFESWNIMSRNLDTGSLRDIPSSFQRPFLQ